MHRPILLVSFLLGAMMATSGASAQNGGAGLFPNADPQIYRFVSIPPGAIIEYRGKLTQFYTNGEYSVQPDDVVTITLYLDGYLPCPFEEGSIGRGRLHSRGAGMVFTCQLKLVPGKPLEGADGPAGWEPAEVDEIDAGPIRPPIH